MLIFQLACVFIRRLVGPMLRRQCLCPRRFIARPLAAEILQLETRVVLSGGTFVPIDPPGSTFTDVYSISGSNVVGRFTTEAHPNFLGFLYDGNSYTIFDFPGSRGSVATSVSGSNVVGTYTKNAGIGGDETAHGFLYNGSTFTTIDPPGSTLTAPSGVSGNNVVGDYRDVSGTHHGFLYNGSTYTDIDPEFFRQFPFQDIHGVSGSNVVGDFVDSGGDEGFYYDGSTYTTIHPPGSTLTHAVGVSGNNVVGDYRGANGKTHGYFYNRSTYTIIDPPGSIATLAVGVSGNNVAGYYYDAAYNSYGFMYDGSTYTTFHSPDGTNLLVTGISGSNIVGTFIDSNGGAEHGFLYQIGTDVTLTSTRFQDTTHVQFNYDSKGDLTPFKVGLYLSSDTTFDANDLFVTGSLINPQSANSENSATITLPQAITSSKGTPFLLVVADPSTTVDNSNQDALVRVLSLAGDIQLGGFTDNSCVLNTLALTYTISTIQSGLGAGEGLLPFDIGFFSATYELGVNEVAGRIEVSENAIVTSQGNLALLGEDAANALKPGNHTLLIRVQSTLSALASALVNPLIDVVGAIADPDNRIYKDDIDSYSDENTAIFCGFYQAGKGTALAVRTGVGSTDEVTIDNTLLSFTSCNAALTRSINFSPVDVACVVVVTADGSDKIHINGALAAEVNGGEGGDTYIFGPSAGNMLSIYESSTPFSLGTDTLDFSAFGRAISIDLSRSESQLINSAAGLRLKLSNGASVENVIGSDSDDHIIGNSLSNALLGGLGNDTLDGADGEDALFGDAFNISGPSLINFLNDWVNLKIPILNVDPIGGGNDVLTGGNGIDVLIGGSGIDILDGGAGGGILIGDAFQLSGTLGPGTDFNDIFQNATDASVSKGLLAKAWTLLNPAFGFGLTGTGNDTIRGGSGVDLIIGGAGNDTANGGGGVADIIFGNDGNDDLNADNATFAILFGGDGNDRLTGSSSQFGGSLLIGDGFAFTGFLPIPTFDIDFEGGSFSSVRFAKLSVSVGLLATGNGNDILNGVSGVNVMIGGDGDDTLRGGDFFNFMMGDSFNGGVASVIDFAVLWSNVSIDDKLQSISNVVLPGLAGSGNDTISAPLGGINIAIGGDGNDRITGGNGPLDILYGNNNNDSIVGGPGFNILVGGDGNDSLIGGNDGNVLVGDSFANTILGVVNYADIRYGRLVSSIGFVPTGTGNDTLTGGSGFIDLLIGGDGDDTLNGGSGLNVMFGDSFNLGPGIVVDVANATSGDAFKLFDTLFSLAGSGNDRITGGANTDIAVGGGGNDTIITLAGVDALFGNDGNDSLDGGAGVDYISGGAGDDTLIAGPGVFDFMYGGSGHDRFIFSKPLSSYNLFTRTTLLLMTDYDTAQDLEIT